MIKIVITGPESTGKTTLAMQLSTYFKTVWVSEYARRYIDQLNQPYGFDDLEKIAKGQLELEDKKLLLAKKLIFCDTDLLTIKIWSEVKFNKCSKWIQKQVEERYYDHYLLCKPDLPWEYDPQREHPEQRNELFFLYEKELKKYGKSFSIIEGAGEQRLNNAIKVIQYH